MVLLANTSGNPLSAGSLAIFMASSLPQGAKPQLKIAPEAVALAVHAGFMAVGYTLVGLGEDDTIGAALWRHSTLAHCPDAQSNAHNPMALPEEWNATSAYTFRYTHPQSTKEFLVKITKLGARTTIAGIALGNDEVASSDLSVNDYVVADKFPATPVSVGSDVADAAGNVQALFHSSGRLNDLGSLLKVFIIQKLGPGLGREGYVEESTQARHEADATPPPGSTQSRPARAPPSNPEPAQPHPLGDPLVDRFRTGRVLPEPIPGFEDEHEINSPPRASGMGMALGPRPFGHNDLYPPGLGPDDPILPHTMPQIHHDFPPDGLLRGPGGGMHPTFDDPMFGGPLPPDNRPPWVPPNVRWDSPGPGVEPRRPPFSGGRGGGNPFGGFASDDFL